MTILDSIKTAEANAELLRQEATNKVAILLEETKKKCDEITKKMYEEAEKKVLQINKDCDQKLIDIEREINWQYDQNDQKIAARAEKQKEAAVDFILERIIEV